MIDAGNKNLSIEELISEAFHSDHQPYLLCKSHAVEAKDRSNLEFLQKLEKAISQYVAFE